MGPVRFWIGPHKRSHAAANVHDWGGQVARYPLGQGISATHQTLAGLSAGRQPSACGVLPSRHCAAAWRTWGNISQIFG